MLCREGLALHKDGLLLYKDGLALFNDGVGCIKVAPGLYKLGCFLGQKRLPVINMGFIVGQRGSNRFMVGHKGFYWVIKGLLGSSGKDGY